MKRAIFRPKSIQIDIQNGVFATPFRPSTLSFVAGEEMLVALRKQDATRLGEYRLLYVVGDYLGERADDAQRLFGEAKWVHFYRLEDIQCLEPFTLDDIVAAAGPTRAAEVRHRYRGQTQDHRIIRTIYPEDEQLRQRIAIVDQVRKAWIDDAGLGPQLGETGRDQPPPAPSVASLGPASAPESQGRHAWQPDGERTRTREPRAEAAAWREHRSPGSEPYRSARRGCLKDARALSEIGRHVRTTTGVDQSVAHKGVPAVLTLHPTIRPCQPIW